MSLLVNESRAANVILEKILFTLLSGNRPADPKSAEVVIRLVKHTLVHVHTPKDTVTFDKTQMHVQTHTYTLAHTSLHQHEY